MSVINSDQKRWAETLGDKLRSVRYLCRRTIFTKNWQSLEERVRSTRGQDLILDLDHMARCKVTCQALSKAQTTWSNRKRGEQGDDNSSPMHQPHSTEQTSWCKKYDG